MMSLSSISSMLLTKTVLLTLLTIFSFTALSKASEGLSFSQMKADVTYLSSDKLKGRGNFSPEINQAAHYISQRFKEIGLKPLGGYKSYQQAFTVKNIMPVSLSVKINNIVINPENTAFISHSEKDYWTNLSDIQIKKVTEKDNLKAIINQCNQNGGQYLLIIDPSHLKMFKRYQYVFSLGKNKIIAPQEQVTPQSLVMVLSKNIAIKSLEITQESKHSLYTLYNIVGALPSQSNSTETVIFSAHYDHLGVASDGKSIFNGADDNASGTTAVMQLASYYAKQKHNQRKVIFAAFVAEEIGGLGSSYFANKIDPSDVITMFNIEMIGKVSKFGAGKFWMTGADKSNLITLLNNELNNKDKETQVLTTTPKGDSLTVYPDPYPEQELFYRSDNAPLAREGVAAHSFSSTQIDTDPHYHQTSDDISTLNLTSMYQVIENLSQMAHPIVEGKVTPSRIEVKKLKKEGLIF